MSRHLNIVYFIFLFCLCLSLHFVLVSHVVVESWHCKALHALVGRDRFVGWSQHCIYLFSQSLCWLVVALHALHFVSHFR